MWFATVPVAVPPSPNVHDQPLMVPSVSLEVLPSTVSARFAALEVNAAVGATFGAVTETAFETTPVAPSSSVTVSVTVLVPAVA
ncbi:hypothetical protein GCM10025868_14720 [Angustibacter aerolatus]|uniref:PASTA domain-containing protein n=1 Tax=Angustibacter aerolatus TaxID=1162965 RepID=A0ABQ6JH53_9ACTN|nr:hypothetical protein GCM10025868_14720 [Angustibacter aerolatus]